MRKLLLILMLSVITGCSEKTSETQDLHDYIPNEAGLIFKIPNPDLFFSHIQNNDFIRENKSYPFYSLLKDRVSFLSHFTPKDPALLIFSRSKNEEFDYTFITRGIPKTINIDSVKNRMVETIKSGEHEIKKYTLKGEVTYTTIIDSIFIAGSSGKMLERLSGKPGDFLLKYSGFEKALKAASEELPVLFINHKKSSEIFYGLFPGADTGIIEDFSDWTSLDLEINPGVIKVNGVSFGQDTIPDILQVFRSVLPAENKLAEITPADAVGFNSFSFENFSILKKNLLKYNKNEVASTSPEKKLLQRAVETGMVYLGNKRVFAIRSTDTQASLKNFTAGSEVIGEYRGIPIYSYSDNNEFTEILEPLVSTGNLQFFMFLDNFIIFSAEKEALLNLVENFQNNTTLAKNEAYISTFENLSTEASILLVRINENFKSVIAEHVFPEYARETKNLSFKNFPVSALQFIYAENFAHVHGILRKEMAWNSQKGVVQTATINIDAPLASTPVFFKNHRTDGLDIVVQDADNTLYLMSQSGKIYWKKDLDFRILGDIQQVDLYRNGRIQLAFVTPEALHIIDRDGNPVNPFPLQFNDEITQPLNVFDYDNNRKYRFPVVQGTEVLMYNSKGRRVRGFDFSGTQGEIISSPKHIRLGRKDYILVSEASGDLSILSRQGNIRVRLKEALSVSQNAWYEHQDRFISINDQGELISIDEQGNIIKENSDLSPERQIAANASTIAILSENKLMINENAAALDFGLYTAPQIFTIGNRTYVSITDLQSHRVFLFDAQARLINGFPVYGNSKIDLGNTDGDKNLEFVVQGEESSILLYEVQVDSD